MPSDSALDAGANRRRNPAITSEFFGRLYSIDEIQRLFSSIPAKFVWVIAKWMEQLSWFGKLILCFGRMGIEVSSLRVSAGGQNRNRRPRWTHFSGGTTQQKLDELLRRIDSVDGEVKRFRGTGDEMTADFLMGTNASLFASLLVEYIKSRVGAR